MPILSSLNSRIRYFLEGIFVSYTAVKIDRFDLTKDENAILVVYRLGRQKLAQKLVLPNFTIKYFKNLSGYDRQRITKFSVLQDLMINIFNTAEKEKEKLITYIKAAIKNDQLF